MSGVVRCSVPAGPIRDLINQHATLGRSHRELARITTISRSTIDAIAQGRSRWVTDNTATRIRGVPLPAPRPRPSNVGCARRVYALNRIGWRLVDIAAAGGYTNQHGLHSALKRGAYSADLAWAIDRAYGVLRYGVGGSKRCRAVAHREGHPPPLAWDGLDIDDPATVPHGPGSPRVPLLSAAYIAAQTGVPIAVLETRPWFQGRRAA